MSEPCLEVHGCGRAGKTELGSVGSPSEILSEYEFRLVGGECSSWEEHLSAMDKAQDWGEITL